MGGVRGAGSYVESGVGVRVYVDKSVGRKSAHARSRGVGRPGGAETGGAGAGPLRVP